MPKLRKLRSFKMPEPLTCCISPSSALLERDDAFTATEQRHRTHSVLAIAQESTTLCWVFSYASKHFHFKIALSSAWQLIHLFSENSDATLTLILNSRNAKRKYIGSSSKINFTVVTRVKKNKARKLWE